MHSVVSQRGDTGVPLKEIQRTSALEETATIFPVGAKCERLCSHEAANPGLVGTREAVQIGRKMMSCSRISCFEDGEPGEKDAWCFGQFNCKENAAYYKPPCLWKC
jgi:hypothetical protein